MKQQQRFQIAQGDVLVTRIDAVPATAIELPSTAGDVHIIGHSETGHHHVVDAQGVRFFRAPDNPLLGYLGVDADRTTLRHLRNWDTHGAQVLGRGIYEIRRQREWAPEGWRPVTD